MGMMIMAIPSTSFSALMRRGIAKRSNLSDLSFVALLSKKFPFILSQTERGLSIRFSSADQADPAWHPLVIRNPDDHFGQYTSFVSPPRNTSKLISSISIRIDQVELANVSMPSYLCVHGRVITNEAANVDDEWNECTYLQPALAATNGSVQEYFLGDAEGKHL
jgi:hypothetical protein